ncbi:MAG: undecaprenyldiphospho-muramoylpentapeptide beta-N-acetylglucosaminyltransferase [bacterium]|nr:undecaprenyldiphospho-muramoylpentapeptide beta-N-acetylglucosaminyltransferase [bacterium]
MRVLIASGGTGGHVFPALSVAEEIKQQRPSARFLFLGAKKLAIEGLCFGEDARVVRLPAVGMPRRISTDVASFVFRLIGSFDVSFRVVANFRPHVAIGFGNFSSVAPLFAARLLGVPVAIHEANAVPGKANLLLSRLSSAVLVNFPGSAAHFPNRNVEVVGMPLRKEFMQPRDRLGALAQIQKLSSTILTLLVVGGSQGARALNREVCNTLPILQKRAGEVQVIHLTGAADYPWVRRRYEALPLRAYVAPFESRMKTLYDAADLVVARSGASTVAEITQTGKPAILVPFPYAASGHQDQNARYLEAKGGAVVLEQLTASRGQATIPGFGETLCQLIADGGHALSVMEANNPAGGGNGNAAKKIADILFRIARPESLLCSDMRRRVAVPL